MTITVFPHEDTLAATFARQLADRLRQQPSLVIGLPTGRTPLALYAQLRTLTASEHLDWSRVRTFNLDEFAGLGAGDERSYRRFMERELFSHVNLPSAQIDFLDGRAPDAVDECARYERAIATAGGIDLQLLGIGANGHIGFNEPGPTLTARTHRVTLLAPSREGNACWFDDDITQVPTTALSMGMATILNAREIVLLATGAAKADAVARMIKGPITTDLPASLLQLHPHVTVLLDEAAAAGLPADRQRGGNQPE
jgi:glucosamine-6-phosphate deaminase